MHTTVSDQRTQATRFFKTRVSQELIGRLPNGEKIPGGPYTIPQVAAGFTVGFIGLRTKPLWQTGQWLLDWSLLLGITAGVVILLKHTVSSEPELLRLRLMGWLGLAQHRKASPGTYRGRAYPLRSAGHRARGRVLIDRRGQNLHEALPSAPEPSTVPAEAPQPAPAQPASVHTPLEPAAPVLAHRTSISGLEHLLASTKSQH